MKYQSEALGFDCPICGRGVVAVYDKRQAYIKGDLPVKPDIDRSNVEKRRLAQQLARLRREREIQKPQAIRHSNESRGLDNM